MEWYNALLLLVGLFLALAVIGMPIGFSFVAAGAFGLVMVKGVAGISMYPRVVHETLNSFVLTAIPLFIFIAEVLEFTGFTEQLFNTIQKWVGKLPGGSGVATVLACAGFGAVSGSSVAAAVTFGRIALPRMLSLGYEKRLTTGTIATAGTLAIMIPPSISMIVYGALSDTSVAKLFIGGIVPGLILAGIFAVYIVTRCTLNPRLAPQRTEVSWGERFRSLPGIVGVMVLGLVILGSIYGGVATPTEAAAIGGMVVLIQAAVYRKLTLLNLWRALMRTALTTGLIMLIVIGAVLMGQVIALLDMARQTTLIIKGLELSPYMVLMMMGIVYILLGMFMGALEMVVLTTPLFVPIIAGLGFDPIWFGILVVLMAELALITPPVGVNVYVVAGVARPYGITMEEVFVACVPYMLLVLGFAFVLVAFPQLALWLPSRM